MNRLSVLLLILLLVLSACSSLHKPLQPQAKSNADNALKLAQDHELQRRYINAVNAFEYALDHYRSFGDTRGQMHALSGLARIKLDQADPASAEDYREEMREIVDLIDPSAAPLLLLYDLHRLLRNGDHARISELAVESAAMSRIEQMQVLSYRVQADAFLGQHHEGRVRKLEHLTRSFMRRPLRKQLVHPQVVSQAAYALAYHYYTRQAYDRALRFLEHSNRIDYSYGNFAGLGYGTWLEAKTREARDELPRAVATYLKALRIFMSTSNLDMVGKTEQDLERLGY